ncbi:lateral signaling target protein 2 homolog isoform X2 [Rhynchophorus ferrugineus]|uniref:Lateral signaling target protein 2 homolog n=1 Tax=Rhynchophorus ferrugineus TaxID=354439 RepID=A0A834MK36_RHYFE|nr:hypothetical protein GWI33_004900 [Rhynchophorus ferrugineus]
MESIRKWFYKPKRDDKSLLAQFFYADEDLNVVANELDSFDGRKDPERCTALVNQLRQAQDKVLTITNAIMDVLIGDERANRDFRVKFPEDVLQENLAGQLWFGAECLAAGSSIMNRESESSAMRPLAKAVTKILETIRNLLRDACLRNNTPNGPIKLDSNILINEMLLESLKIFDRLFAQFELDYVSAMVPVKTPQEYELQELISVLFSETLRRALRMRLLTQDTVDDCDPALMFTVPRLAIVNGLLVFPDGPLGIDKPAEGMSEMFRPFRRLLRKIRELLWTLDKRELYTLEKLLCDNEQIDGAHAVGNVDVDSHEEDFIDQFYQDFPYWQLQVMKGKDKLAKKTFENPVFPVSQSMTDLEVPSEGPSTSGCLIPQSLIRNTIIASATSPGRRSNSHSVESPPEHDYMEVINAAAATLSSILNIKETSQKERNDLESPDDSGISTGTTSLERSPSMEHESRGCGCAASRHSDRHDYSRSPKKSSSRGSRYSKSARSDASRHRYELSSSSSSSETSSVSTDITDDEETVNVIELMATRQLSLRSKYRSSEDLIHRLFVCIAGVADQLQTNFASDLRNILKSVFLINASDTSDPPDKQLEPPSLDASIEYHPSEDEVIENEFTIDPNILAQEALFDTNVYFHLTEGCPATDYTNHQRQYQLDRRQIDDRNRYASPDPGGTRGAIDPPRSEPPHGHETIESPPVWIPDVQAPRCMSCGSNFTVMKRRHHCRNCGKVFCARCSPNSVPLPKYGLVKPVRVCNKCFLYSLTPFTIR